MKSFLVLPTLAILCDLDICRMLCEQSSYDSYSPWKYISKCFTSSLLILCAICCFALYLTHLARTSHNEYWFTLCRNTFFRAIKMQKSRPYDSILKQIVVIVHVSWLFLPRWIKSELDGVSISISSKLMYLNSTTNTDQLIYKWTEQCHPIFHWQYNKQPSFKKGVGWKLDKILHGNDRKE